MPDSEIQPHESLNRVRRAVQELLGPHGFLPVPCAHPDVVHAWTRKTWNTNRGVVLIHERTPEVWAPQNKIAVGRALGYFPFFYGLGLQVISVAPGVTLDDDVLKGAVDRIDNQRCIVQSLFTLDPSTLELGEARTWGQVVTGRFQDAVAAALVESLGPLPDKEPAGPPNADNPFAPPA